MEQLISLLMPSLLQMPAVQNVLALPLLLKLFMVMGVFRALLKPTFAYLHTVVAATPSKADDELLEKVEQSKAYKMVAFVCDWLLSVKLIK